MSTAHPFFLHTHSVCLSMHMSCQLIRPAVCSKRRRFSCDDRVSSWEISLCKTLSYAHYAYARFSSSVLIVLVGVGVERCRYRLLSGLPKALGYSNLINKRGSQSHQWHCRFGSAESVQLISLHMERPWVLQREI